MEKWERDLSKHVNFLRDVIANLKEINWSFNVCTKGPWYSVWGPRSVLWFRKQTAGRPRGVAVRDEEIYVLFEPTVVDGVHIDTADDGPTPLWKVEKMRSVFRRTPALMLHQVQGNDWSRAWLQTARRWKNRGREVPDFGDFLEEN